MPGTVPLTHISQFGEFDCESDLDALFPLLAQKRLGKAYLIRAVSASEGSSWADARTPRSVHLDLADRGLLGGVLLGGGDMIGGLDAGSPYVAKGALGRLAQPLLWLGAGVRAARDGVPLCWLAPGVPRAVDSHLERHLRWLAEASELVAVHDQASRLHLIAAGVRSEVVVVPDPLWEIDRLWDRALLKRTAWEALGDSALEPEEGYVAIQLSEQDARRPPVELAAEIRKIARLAECRPLLLIFGARDRGAMFARSIATELGSGTPIVYADSLVLVAAVLAGARLYVGAALNGVLAALSLSVPAVAVASAGERGLEELSGQLEQVQAGHALVERWPGVAEAARLALAMSDTQRAQIREAAAAPLQRLWRSIEVALAEPVDADRKRHQLAQLLAFDEAENPSPVLSALVGMWAEAGRAGRRPRSPEAVVDEPVHARRLERRLRAASTELDAARSERDRIVATADQLRGSTIDFQRGLHEADSRLRAVSAELDRLKSRHRAELRSTQRMEGEIEQLKWHAGDRALALAEARALFIEQRAMVDELSGEIRLALADLRRTEAAVGTRLGHALARAGNIVRRSPSTDPLYLGLARLEDLDGRLIRRQRPELRARPSRAGVVRQRVTVVSWEMAHNPVGRAHALAEILGRSHEVELVGPSFPRYGSGIWGPIRDSNVPMRVLPGTELPGFVADAQRFVRSLRTDLVYVSKPRFPSLLLAMLIKHARGVPVIVDVDDREVSFFNGTAGISLEELASRHDEPDFRLPFGESWTLACDQLVRDADAVTVSSEVLRDLYGGTIVPHARDERRLNPALYDRDAIRAELGYSPEDRVVLFVGTPRMHKGLTELAEAIEQIDDPRYKLCVVGTITDPPLKRALSVFAAGRVKLLENRPLSEVARTTLIGDLVCLLQQPEDEISRYQTPAKLTDALAMGVPVLARETPPLAPFVRQGLIELVGDAPISERIRELLADPAATQQRTLASREFFLTHLSYAAAAETLERVEADLPETGTEPPASWRCTLDIARSVPPPGGLRRTPAPRIPRLFPAPRRRWDVVFFWKQNDSWIYGRRSDMLMKYLASSDRTRRLIHFDAPMNWDTVEYYRRRGRGAPGDQAAEIYRHLRHRALIPERHGKLRSYTFLARAAQDPAAWQRALLPTEDEYLGYIDHVLRRAGIGKRPVLFWVWPVNLQFPQIHAAFSPALTVADVVDDQRGWIKPGTPYYERLTDNYQAVLDVSDVVLANCDPVRERMSWFGVDPLVVPNAMEIFAKSSRPPRRPAELRHLRGPIIGYVGNLGARIDMPLLDRLASERQDCEVVIIGSMHLSNEILELDRHPNVHFLGVRPYPEVIRYIRCFDVAIIPHRDDELTRSMNPLKAYVYAGCEVPVVTTEIANLPDLGGAIRTAPSHDDFMIAVAEVLNGPSQGERPGPPRELLERHTWAQRVSQIERILDAAGESRAIKAGGALIPA